MPRRTASLPALLLLLVIGLIVALFFLDLQSSRQNHPPSGRSERASRVPANRNENRRRATPHAPQATGETTCPGLGVNCASQYFATWAWPADQSCHTTERNGYPEPDNRCTPGGVVPGVTADTLRSPDWSTRCIRNCQSTEKQKHAAYAWYGLPAPANNNGATQTCELDHLVPLELGGADGLGNIWPQCGPDDVALRQRYFKQKDIVENYLAAKVRAGEIPLDQAQRGIAQDWVQYLPVAKAFCSGGTCD